MRLLWSRAIQNVGFYKTLVASSVTFRRMVVLAVFLTLTLLATTCGNSVRYKSWTFHNVIPQTQSEQLGCDFPPSLWCSSKDIARRCQVESQCEDNVWAAERHEAGDAAPVRFTTYLESLCPDCKQFMTDTLWPAWQNLNTIMDIEIVPYGNADERKGDKGWEFECQHGLDECIGNVIETCAIHLLKNATVYFPFIHCIEKSDNLPINQAPKIEPILLYGCPVWDMAQNNFMCADKLKIDYQPIHDCSTGPLGNRLEHEMAVKTDNLEPQHTFVPWVTLNGVHTDEIQHQAITNLVKLICDTYKGPKPTACKKQLNVHRKRST